MSSLKLSKLIKILLYILALTPLAITPWTIFPFVFGRGLIMQFLVEAIFALYLVLAIFDKKFRPRKNILMILLAGYIAILFIASIFGADFGRSFWGIAERFTGWFYLFHILIFFVVISSVFKKNDWRNYLKFNAGVAIIMLGIASLSLFHIKFWGVDLGTRISGTLGNSIFFASYLILSLIFALYLFCAEEEKKNKIIWLTIALIFAYGITLTQTRGALLGLVAGIGVGLFYYGLINKQKKVRVAILSFVAVALLSVGLLFVFKNSVFVKKNSLLNRITGISLSDGTGRTRILSWQIALQGIKERPLLGWGAGEFYAVFNQYYNPEFLRYSYYETWSDKPHNAFLEVGVDSGIIGVALYLAIFGYAGHLILKKKKNGALSIAQAAVLGGGLVAYFVQNLFVFDTGVSYLLFAIVLGFINQSDAPSGGANANVKIRGMAAIPVVALIFGAGFLNFFPFVSDAKFRNAFVPEDLTQKVNLSVYEEADKYFNPYKEEWRDDIAKRVLSSLKTGQNIYTEDEVKFVVSELLRSVRAHEKNAYYHLLLGGIYSELGAKDAANFDLAKKELDRAFALSPSRQHIYFALGRYYALKGDAYSMIDTYKKAIDFEPKAAISYWEGAKQLYFIEPDNPLVQEWLVRAAELGYSPETNTEFLFIFQRTFNYFLENKQYNVLEGFYLDMEKIEPGEAKWHAQRATTLYFLKKYDEAKDEITAAIVLDENYQEEGEKFIEMIEAGKK